MTYEDHERTPIRVFDHEMMASQDEVNLILRDLHGRPEFREYTIVDDMVEQMTFQCGVHDSRLRELSSQRYELRIRLTSITRSLAERHLARRD